MLVPARLVARREHDQVRAVRRDTIRPLRAEPREPRALAAPRGASAEQAEREAQQRIAERLPAGDSVQRAHQPGQERVFEDQPARRERVCEKAKAFRAPGLRPADERRVRLPDLRVRRSAGAARVLAGDCFQARLAGRDEAERPQHRRAQQLQAAQQPGAAQRVELETLAGGAALRRGQQRRERLQNERRQAQRRAGPALAAVAPALFLRSVAHDLVAPPALEVIDVPVRAGRLRHDLVRRGSEDDGAAGMHPRATAQRQRAAALDQRRGRTFRSEPRLLSRRDGPVSRLAQATGTRPRRRIPEPSLTSPLEAAARR